MAEIKNRRQSQRSDAAFTLAYSIEKPYDLRISLGLAEEASALMLDLSGSGAAIITQYDLPLGTQLRVKFNLMNLRLKGEQRSRSMELIADVVSNAVLPNEGHRIGFSFNKISEADRTAISDFIKSKQ